MPITDDSTITLLYTVHYLDLNYKTTLQILVLTMQEIRYYCETEPTLQTHEDQKQLFYVPREITIIVS